MRSAQTLISTPSRIMQLISLAPAPIRAFADMETLGPICSIRLSITLFFQKNRRIIVEAFNQDGIMFKAMKH